MTAQLLNRRVAAWMALMAASIVSFGSSQSGNGQPWIVIAAIMGVAMFKVAVIGYEYIELKDAPLPLRLIYSAWIIVTGGVLLVLL